MYLSIDLERSVMNSNAATCRLAATGIIFWALQAPVRADDSRSGTCPTNYIVLGPICLNEASGDVINQTIVAPDVSTRATQCRSGYELIQQVCISATTGDVELPSSTNR